MERSMYELRNYAKGLKEYLNKLGGVPLSDTKTIQEMVRSMKLLTEYLSDTLDTVEKEHKTLTAQIQDIADDSQRYSMRSTAMVKDISNLNKKVEEFDELKKSVDNLTNIILRNLKTFPTSGDEYVEPEEKTYPSFHQTFTMKTYQSKGEEFDLPYRFEGTVTLNGQELTEVNGDFVITLCPGFKTYKIYGPLHVGDVIEFLGIVKEEM